jgi:hypothetical protein
VMSDVVLWCFVFVQLGLIIVAVQSLLRASELTNNRIDRAVKRLDCHSKELDLLQAACKAIHTEHKKEPTE